MHQNVKHNKAELSHVHVTWQYYPLKLFCNVCTVMAENSVELLMQLETFFGSSELTAAINGFMRDAICHQKIFAAEASPAGEQSLQHHQAFRQYTNLIEEHLERFLAEHGISQV